MADRLVLDASAALTILLDEPSRPSVNRCLDGHTGEVLVPAHFWLEIVNTLTRRQGCTTDTVVQAFRDIDELEVQTIALDRPTMLLAVDLVARHGLTAYDAAYLALAEAAEADLLTLDGDLAAAAGARSLLGGLPRSRRLHEELAPYETATTWANHGRYLAELRRAAAG
jgi:predicted nucleic acid-binding protein